MSYLTQNEIASSFSMNNRVAQAVSEEGVPDGTNADAWTSVNRREWAAAPGWSEAWESAKVSHVPDDDPLTPAYDPGTDEGVITDGMILSQVQAMLGAEPDPEGQPEG